MCFLHYYLNLVCAMCTCVCHIVQFIARSTIAAIGRQTEPEPKREKTSIMIIFFCFNCWNLTTNFYVNDAINGQLHETLTSTYTLTGSHCIVVFHGRWIQMESLTHHWNLIDWLHDRVIFNINGGKSVRASTTNSNESQWHVHIITLALSRARLRSINMARKIGARNNKWCISRASLWVFHSLSSQQPSSSSESDVRCVAMRWSVRNVRDTYQVPMFGRR